MATRQRPFDIGTERCRILTRELGREIRAARVDRGLSMAEAGKAAGLSMATVSRIERGVSQSVALAQLARLMAVVGLELHARAYPGGQPVRDGAHAELLRRFRATLHRELRWSTEVPLPRPGDLRAWDALIRGPDWHYGVEAETSPNDGQALARRLSLKVRDGGVDGLLLVLPDRRRSREFLRAAESLRPNFKVDGRRALERLGAGVDPGGSAIILV